MKGPTEEASILNNYLDSLRNKAFNYQQEIWREGNELSVATFKAKWLGIKEKAITLMDIFLEHNRKMKELVGKEYVRLMYIRYETSLEHIKKFLRYKYAVDDIDVKKPDYEFISEFAFWLKSVRNCNQNSTIRYLSNFKKIVNLCIQNGFIQRNPFAGFKLVKKEVAGEILSNEELEKMASLKFKSERSEHVRDIFLFCCYTGLADGDIKKLKRSEIVVGVDGEKWIFTSRQKTKIQSRIPLLPSALQVLSRYENHPRCIYEDRILPVLSNQKMNEY